MLSDAHGALVETMAQYIGEATNNQAEYRALIAGLERAMILGATDVVIQSDSELMVRQILGEYRVKNEKMKPLYEKTRRLLTAFATFTIRHVRREENSEADALVNAALDQAMTHR